MRFYLATLQSINDWPSVLPHMQVVLNNSQKVNTTGKTPTEILFGFHTQEALDFLQVQDPDTKHVQLEETTALPISMESNTMSQQHPTLAKISGYRPSHINTADTIAFVVLHSKEYYNTCHQPLFFKVGDSVNLHLHHRYNLPGITNQKTNQQFVGPLCVVE